MAKEPEVECHGNGWLRGLEGRGVSDSPVQKRGEPSRFGVCGPSCVVPGPSSKMVGSFSKGVHD